jgi:hypothetical protein
LTTSVSVTRCWSASLSNFLEPGVALRVLVLIVALMLTRTVAARELLITVGGGPQPNSEQTNTTAGIDFSFARFKRSVRQHIQIGVSYTYLSTNTDTNSSLWAVSIYPQLSLYPDKDGRFRGFFPEWAEPYFFVRALAPSYISESQLGEREQANHFAFQAQIGVGLTLNFPNQRQGLLSLSWKHFSNANLYSKNDGIDIPLVLSLGLKF